jgi:hypothetical protein
MKWYWIFAKDRKIWITLFILRWPSYGLLRRVVWQEFTDVLEVSAASSTRLIGYVDYREPDRHGLCKQRVFISLLR